MENKWHHLKDILTQHTSKSRRPDYITHAETTLDWPLKLEPNATWEMELAAFAHDIERCWFDKMAHIENEQYIDYKIRHSQRSARFRVINR
ncbi:hypothetical protein JXA34_02675 [Patescibacteria group bacterium]|nr:hypothetical protein [Patescibacteria group bacterium]